jgi:hypothetical protein
VVEPGFVSGAGADAFFQTGAEATVPLSILALFKSSFWQETAKSAIENKEIPINFFMT